MFTEKEGFKPWEMWHKMMGSMGKEFQGDRFEDQELADLFTEWCQQVEDEVLDFLQDKADADVEAIAGHLRITNKSVIHFISRLAQKEKISLKINLAKN